MALRFVTAKTGSAHITSADWKSLNRGVVGKEKYLLVDTSNNDQGGFTALPSQGEISIPPCSLMWSGAHIRNTTTTVLKYTPPTVESTVNVWFHYLKDADAGIESLDFVVTINDQPSPIVDEIEDNTLEAYTLFCFFTHKVESTEEVSYNRAFKSITTSARTQEKLDEQWGEFNLNLNKEIEDRKSDSAIFGAEIGAIKNELPKLRQGVDVIAENLNKAPTPYGTTIASSTTPLENYRMIVLEGENGTLTIPACVGEFSDYQIIVESVSVTSATKTTQIKHDIQIHKTANTGFIINHIVRLSTDSEFLSKVTKINTVYGIR